MIDNVSYTLLTCTFNYDYAKWFGNSIQDLPPSILYLSELGGKGRDKAYLSKEQFEKMSGLTPSLTVILYTPLPQTVRHRRDSLSRPGLSQFQGLGLSHIVSLGLGPGLG